MKGEYKFMKKKAIKIAASAAVAASAFAAAAPAQQADAAVNVDQLALDAQNAGTVLKWAISVEGSADFTTRPYDAYNAAKATIAKVENAIKGLSTSEKVKYEAKLVEPKIQVKRAQAYIDAITSSEKIQDLTSGLKSAVNSEDLDKVETAYHKATAEYRKQAKLLDRVYGQTTRDGIRNAVKPALEKAVADLQHDVTVKMALDKASELIEDKEYAKAASYVAEAEKYLATAKNFKSELKSSLEDVVESMPLTVTSVSVLNDTTLVVSLNKEVVAVAASEFTFNNGLVATSAKLGSDKKTVTLTTTKQEAGKAYTISYKEGSVQFTTPTVSGNVTVDQTEVHAETTESIALVTTFKTKQGTNNNNPVKVTVPTDYKVISINGNAATIASGGNDIVTPIDGKIVLGVTANATTTPATGKKIKFEQLSGANNGEVEETKESGKLNFYVLDTAQTFTTTTGVVEYVDSANNYFVANSGNKYKLKATGYVYQGTDNSVLSLDVFKSKLSKGDIVTGEFVKDGATVLKLALDKVDSAEFKLEQELVANTNAFRVAGNTITFSGKGEAGKVISIYNTTKALAVGATTADKLPLAQTRVDSNGKWEVTVAVDPTITAGTAFSARQATSVNEIAPEYVLNLAGATTPLLVKAGEFKANGVAPAATLSGAADESLNGDKFTYTIDGAYGDKVVVTDKDTTTIKLVDGDLTVATFTNGVNNTKIKKESDSTFSITFGQPVSISGGDGKLTGSLSVNDLTGVENEYGIKLKASSLTNIYGY
jgi:hypothetical protein